VFREYHHLPERTGHPEGVLNLMEIFAQDVLREVRGDTLRITAGPGEDDGGGPYPDIVSRFPTDMIVFSMKILSGGFQLGIGIGTFLLLHHQSPLFKKIILTL